MCSLINNLSCLLNDFFVFQGFGTAEGGRVQDLKEMAEAAGQSFPGFTPPNGETQEQVRLDVSSEMLE